MMRASPNDVRGEARRQSTKPASGSLFAGFYFFPGRAGRRRRGVMKRVVMLDTGDLLRRFGCSRPTLYRCIYERGLKPCKSRP